MFFALLPSGREFCEIPWSLSVEAKLARAMTWRLNSINAYHKKT